MQEAADAAVELDEAGSPQELITTMKYSEHDGFITCDRDSEQFFLSFFYS